MSTIYEGSVPNWYADKVRELEAERDKLREALQETEIARNKLWLKAEKLAEALRIIEAYADSIHVIGGSLGTCEHCLYQCAQDALSEVEAK